MYASNQHNPVCPSDDALSLMDAIITMYPLRPFMGTRKGAVFHTEVIPPYTSG